MRRIRSFALASVALTAVLGAVPAAAAAPTTTAHLNGFSCPVGQFCIYSGYKGQGDRCHWPQSSKANTADDCAFIRRGHNVGSVWNGTGHRVQYYTQTNFHNRVGSTKPGAGGNLMGSYQIRSFKPQ